MSGLVHEGETHIHDLAVIVVSTNEARWLSACLSSVLEHRGSCSLEVVVADNESTDGTAALVEEEFPEARVVRCVNRGFAHANNRGLETTNARYVLFLNPDTEIRTGTFEALVRRLDEQPDVGLAGVIQLTPEGEIYPTIRYFPNALRAFGQALGSERLSFRAQMLRERDIDLDRYSQVVECDWTSGSFMLARREALQSAGFLDERFFIYSEEPDLCLRMKRAGWKVCARRCSRRTPIPGCSTRESTSASPIGLRTPPHWDSDTPCARWRRNGMTLAPGGALRLAPRSECWSASTVRRSEGRRGRRCRPAEQRN
jgi:GT2 family glycosyltransferase